MNLETEIKIERVWAMPNRYTFKIKPIAELLKREVIASNFWVDPFAGNSQIAYWTNDVNPETNAKLHQDALCFLQRQPKIFAAGVLYDPPYSITQARKYGKAEYGNKKYWSSCKDEIAKIIKPGGQAICFGWNSGGLGKNRGFKLQEILLVAHGGGRNDTIVTVEIKL